MEWEQNGCSGLVSKRGGAAAEMKKEGGNSREGELGRLSSLVRESLSGGEGEERDLQLKKEGNGGAGWNGKKKVLQPAGEEKPKTGGGAAPLEKKRGLGLGFFVFFF